MTPTILLAAIMMAALANSAATVVLFTNSALDYFQSVLDRNPPSFTLKFSAGV